MRIQALAEGFNIALFWFSALSVWTLSLSEVIEDHCISACPFQQINRTDIGDFDYGCNQTCKIEQCGQGCKLWKESLKSSCRDVCNGADEPLPPPLLHCVIGCNSAITHYFNQLRDRIQIPPAPALVPDSLTATSLRLKWYFPEATVAAADGLSYLVQWRYEELADTWQYCRNQTWNAKEDTVFVDELMPYTKYRFRVALLLSSYNSKLHHSELIVSEPSVVILTQAEGHPASAPVIVRAVPVDSYRISVSWEPGPFPHGPLLTYVLVITNVNQNTSITKEIPSEQQYYTFRNLKPSENYSISLQMRNEVGAGPASHIIVSTPMEPTVKDNEKLVLILRTEHTVFDQGIEISDEPKELYSTEEKIEGIALHVGQQLLFLSDSSGSIYRHPLNISHHHHHLPARSARQILTPAQSAYATPSLLSVDWLNGQLYVLGEVRNTGNKVRRWQVIRCGLDGSGVVVVVAGLVARPKWMEVDPYNGFLFWVIHKGTESGLYRLDLANVSNGIKHNVHPEHILAESNLGAFTIDHNNFRLLISYQNNSTVYSVSLDGKEVYNIRKNIATSRMEKITSLAYTNKKFYWTNDSRLFYEEYHQYTDSYYQNSYPDFNNMYKTVLVNLESAQPIPIPVNPPRAVQAIFGVDKAKISWQAPHLLGGQGKGAWQNWSYELSIKDVLTGHVDTSHRNITLTSYTLYHLLPNRKYVIKASAYTDHGTGPWSSEFSGRTLRENKEDEQQTPVFFWATNKGLLMSDATGDDVVTLLDTTAKSDESIWKGSYFTDMTWYQNQLYLVSNGSKVLWFNTTTRRSGEILDIGSVGSIAIDWIGKKLYWSNPQKQLINRGNLDGSQQEPLPIITLAKELNIDSVNAYLYWSSGYSVECAHLNGANKIVYHPAELFEKQVMGVTLDTDHHYVYWIVRGSDGSHLYRAPMMGTSGHSHLSRSHVSFNTERMSYNLPRSTSTMRGPLRYFHGRLLWLGDDQRAVIGDLHENKTAVVTSATLSGLNMFYVMDKEVYKLPNTTRIALQDICVIPEPVDNKSIEIQGTWQSFNVTWSPVKRVNYGTVFYEIKIDTDLITNDTAVITTTTSFPYPRTIPPFTPLHITIRPYTYYSPQSHQTHSIALRSPESTPDSPLHLRAYVTHLHMRSLLLAEDIQVTFRWRAPGRSNGVIIGYKVRCWFKEHDGDRLELCEGIVVTDMEYVLGGLLENETYYFQVQAFTSIGDGILSPVLGISTASQYPVPTLILTGRDSIYRLDVDNNRTETILSSIPTPIELAYLLTENRLFWINDANELYMYNIETFNKAKILIEEDYLHSITIDWLERAIYYVRRDFNDSTICKIDLNYLDKGILKKDIVILRPGRINKVEVSPFTQKLFWTELDQNDIITLQASHINGSNITQLFTKRKVNKRDTNLSKCDCPSNIGDTISKSFTLDHSQDKNNPSLVIIDTQKNEVLASDTEGCNCKIISTKVTNHYINDIKIDQVYIYWTSKMNLYIVNRNTGELTIQERLHATDVSIFGTHMQPYPNTECLMPKVDQNLTVTLINSTSNSVTLSMPGYAPNDDCQHVTIAAIEYHIYYRAYNFNSSLKRLNPEDTVDNLRCDETCTQQVSFHSNVTVKDLLPYNKYVFAVSIGNYFTDISKRKTVIGPGVVFNTSVGAPSHARKINATVLTPNLIRVCWSAPLHPNGDRVHYEVHWETDGRATTGIRQKGDLIYLDDSKLVRNNDDSQILPDCEHRVLLKDLTPNEMYTIGVRSFSNRNQSLSTPGDRLQVTTFPEPDDITVIDIKPYELVLQWNVTKDVVAYNIQFALLSSTTWENISSVLLKKDHVKNDVIVSVPTLSPKTFYKFRLILKYALFSQLYYWPKDQRFTFETLGDKPSTPGTPLIQHINEVYQVSWEASKANGAQVEEYLLQMMKSRNYRVKRGTNRTSFSYLAPSIEETDFEWETSYNGTDTFWRMENLSEKYKYVFRVKARNSYGWSNYSAESLEFDWSSATQLAEKQDFTIIMIAVFIMAVLIFIALFCGLVACNCCKANKKSQQIIVTTRGPDVELATLRELPRRSNFIHNTNVLYISTQITPEQITLLPHIRRDQITLTKFLGSGAFGEVFEGTAKGCANMHGNAETKVAVKTLRKGATDQEKMEFLQEAQLMSHFKHEHILQLLGVCLDNDPHFIIMELMQGGDLLTYLRLSRKANTNSPPLTLLDLVKMCLDVAKGCRYLEEMHFVHRDLACRNCLVSSTDPNDRIVKIGDFGLARDIYKNDYYRKEGEGLLPVRWMAPESLVDGVFTSQSDVWAFGVLLWEIMTLGQQPYPARNNLEVLHYVKRGGRLGKPIDCPEDLHALMLKCWNYESEQRPTFKHCLEILERLYLDLLSNPVTGVHTGQYISTVPLHYGVFNQAYFQDENHNNSGNSWKSGSESDTSRERTPFLSTGEPPSGEIPKYLELLYDGDAPVENNGYEVPRSVPLDNKTDSPTNIDTSVTSLNVNSNNKAAELEISNTIKNVVVDDDKLLNETVDTNVGYTNMTPEKKYIQ